MKTSLQDYRQSRGDLLTRMIADLSNDERFLAAWLTGSYARNEADEVSDLDLNLVVADPYSDSLCMRQEQISHETTEERLALFHRFGESALIHENNDNAPDGGTFTFVLYADSAVMIDWTLIPQKHARRPFPSLLLFDKANVPVAFPPKADDLDQDKKYVSEQWAFFWMMTAITLKYVIRKDDVFVTNWLENLHRIIREIERRIRREPPSYRGGSLHRLPATRKKQIESIQQLCKKMQELRPQIVEFTQMELLMPLTEIETLLSLAKK